MKKDLGDHVGKQRGWAWLELFELVKLAIKHRAEIIETVKDILKKKKDG